MQVFQTLCTICIKSFIISYVFLICCFTAHLFTATCSLGQLLFKLLVQTPLSSFVPAPILLLPSHSSPPLNHTLDCSQVLQQHSDNPFNHSCPTILFYTASTAGFRRYIVCIPIYPYFSYLSSLFLIFCTLTLSIFVDTIPLNLSQVSYHFLLFSLLLIFSSSCYLFTGFRLRIQSARAQPLQRRNSPPPRLRAHPFTRVDPSATLVVCFQQHRPHAGTINLVTSSINMLFDSTAGRTRMRLHSRWKA